MSLLGLDIGTTGCKAVAFNLDGGILAAAYREYPLVFSRPGWIELDGNGVWEKAKEAIREVTARTARDPIQALAVSAQGEAVMPLDKKGRILHHSIVTFDNRATGYVRWWRKRLGNRKLFRITGMPLSGMYTLGKIQWMHRHRPAVAKKTWKWLCYEDFILFRLGCPPTMDYSLAARTMAFDISRKTWSPALLRIADIDPSLLPEIKASGEIVGVVSDVVAAELGLPKGVACVTGGHDQPCGALGSGIIEPRKAMYATGTTECIAPVFSRHVLSERMLANNLCCYPHVMPGRFISLAFNFTGGSLLRWYRDIFGNEEVREANRQRRIAGTGDGRNGASSDPYDLLTAKATKAPTNLFVLPHFTMTGTPYFDTQSKGVILGLTLSTSKGDMIKAILEGVTYEMKLNVRLLERAGVPIDEFRAIGGGAKSTVWMQLKADLLGKPVAAPAVSEAACLGAALLSGTAVGAYRSLREAVRHTVKIKRTFEPHPGTASIYEERFAIYRQIYPATKPITRQI